MKYRRKIVSRGLIIIAVLLAIIFLNSYAMIFLEEPESVQIVKDDITLFGDIHKDRSSSGNGKFMILIHSSNILARQMSFNRIYAFLLSKDITVLNIDLPGFGESIINHDITTKADMDFSGAINAWLNYISKRYDLPLDRIVLMGRGTGAGSVIQYMHDYPERKNKIILVVPPRGDGINNSLYSSSRPYLQVRWEQDMPGNHHVSLDLIREIAPHMRLESLPDVQNGRNVLLIDSPATMDSDNLLEVFDNLSGPKSLYLAEKKVDHYFGTKNYWNRFVQMLNRKFPLLIIHRGQYEKILLKINNIVKPV